MAKEIAETNLRSPMITPLLAEINQVCLSLIAVYQEDRNAASVQHDALASLTNREVTALFGSQPDHVLGLLARTAGELDQAIGHFEDALSISRSRGYLSMLAWTCCDYADMLKERDNEGDRAKAINLLDESLAISSELGMRPLMERVLSRRHFDAEGECQQILIESRSGDLDIGDAAIPSVCWNLHSYCQPGAAIYCNLIHGIADRRPTLT